MKILMKRELLRAVIGLCLIALEDGARAEVVANGGLEPLPGDTFKSVMPGASYAGWRSVGSGDIEFTTDQTAVPGGFFGPMAEGSGCVDLNGIRYQGAVSQMLTNKPGVDYAVCFAMSGNPGVLGTPRRGTKTMDVTWGGTNVGSFVFTHLPTDTQTNIRWEYHKIYVTGTGLDEIRFTSTSGTYNDAGPVIDDISVSPLPDTYLAVRVSQVELCWNSLSNFTYQLQYRSMLTTNLWLPFGGPVLGIDGVICTNDTVVPGELQKYYRVIRVP
jgi:hypothetical protein